MLACGGRTIVLSYSDGGLVLHICVEISDLHT